MTDSSDANKDLAQLLIENNLISEAQANLARGDQSITGLRFEEVLLLRGWIQQDALLKVAPWLNSKKSAGAASSKPDLPAQAAPTAQPAQPAAVLSARDESRYEKSRQSYKQLMEQILDTSWD